MRTVVGLQANSCSPRLHFATVDDYGSGDDKLRFLEDAGMEAV
jgi:hypothetical protein